MGRKTISPFIYDGMLEYQLRIPLARRKPDPQLLYTRCYMKKEYTLQDVKDIRNNIMKEMEADGRRAKDTKHGRSRLIASTHKWITY